MRTRNVWHGIATDWLDEAWLDRHAAGADDDLEAQQQQQSPGPRAAQVRFRYLPWCMRNNQMLYFIVTGVVLLVAVLVVSFVPSTDIRRGFPPGVPPAPVAGAFLVGQLSLQLCAVAAGPDPVAAVPGPRPVAAHPAAVGRAAVALPLAHWR